MSAKPKLSCACEAYRRGVIGSQIPSRKRKNRRRHDHPAVQKFGRMIGVWR